MYNISPKSLFIGRKVRFLPTCHSTNDIASEMARDEAAFEGTIVITSAQTAGRGQRGNSWEAETGKNLTFSLILKPVFLTANDQFQLNIAVSLGIRNFLLNYCAAQHVWIKWPNDIYYKDRKMGGVLIENALKKYTIATAVIGIGLNINQIKFGESKAVSLLLATQQAENSSNQYDLSLLLSELAESLEKYYLQLRSGSIATLRQEYLTSLYWFGEDHVFKSADQLFWGKITGIDAIGRLEVATEESVRYFGLKEIKFIQ